MLYEQRWTRCLRAKQEGTAKQNHQDMMETWRPEVGKILPLIPEGVEPVIRIKAPKTGEIRFTDGVKGEMKLMLHLLMIL